MGVLGPAADAGDLNFDGAGQEGGDDGPDPVPNVLASAQPSARAAAVEGDFETASGFGGGREDVLIMFGNGFLRLLPPHCEARGSYSAPHPTQGIFSPAPNSRT